MNTSYRKFDEAGWAVRPTTAVKWLLIANFAVFLLQQVFRAMDNQLFADFLKLSAQKVHEGCLWQFATYMFLHGSVIHLLLNLLMLYFFGNEVEFALGPKHFLGIYFGGGIVGGLTWFVFNLHTAASMVGASGAVYAVTLAFAALYPRRPITLLVFFVVPITLLARQWAIVAVALKHNLYILSDEMYEHLVYDKARPTCIATFSPEVEARTITVAGFSKTYAMTGWRIGTTVAPLPIAKAIAELQSQMSSNVTTFAQYGALAALKEKEKTAAAVQKMVIAFDRRRKFLHAELNKIPGITCLLAEGAFYLFPNISSFGLKDLDFCARLLE
ncbi:MAG: aminotransferase class I/II-fold pyridoxal phosphate-dependent enzyme, partial [Verrucomicrobiae bacterium]|nr:aminotransferase class I/II-fold pyridoxal phosphate-dependent enzyme [Verrucomicrobiae bacterium]